MASPDGQGSGAEARAGNADVWQLAFLRVLAGFALMVSTGLSAWALREVTQHGERLAALEVTASRNVETLARLEAKLDRLLQK